MPPADARTPPPFPTRFALPPALVLPPRQRTAPPSLWGLTVETAPPPVDADRALRRLEARLAERERLVGDAEVRLAERTRDLDELEALLQAREALLDAARTRDANPRAVVTHREAEALQQLRAELDRQESLLRESRQTLRERETFLEESETRLFAKVQTQQEKETELEQREEDLRTREFRAASIAPRPYDEFRE